MLASRLGGLLPALSAAEALQVMMLHSIAGLPGDAITGVKRMLLFDGVNCEGRDIYT